jgi:micrococcal nuclease
LVATLFVTGILAITFFMGFLTRDKLTSPKTLETKVVVQDLPTPDPAHKPIEKQENKLTDGEYIVARVLDGDTIDLTNGVRIRYEGIDAPEKTESYGLDGLADNQKLVNGKKIRVEVSDQKTDTFGRTLAYVWSDNVFVNERLVEDGYARVYVYAPTRPPKYLKQLQEAEARAKQDGWGMWIEEKIKK